MRVQLIDGGSFTAPLALFHQGAPEGERFRFPVPAYLIEVGAERILVDTGLNPAAVADPGEFYEQPQVMGLFGFEQERGVAAQVEPEALTMVVLTHLHWDHVGGLPQIPASVPVVVQRREWEAGQDPEAVARNFYMPRDYEGERELVLVDGDHDLLGDGSVELLSTPGHTPGHQSVRVGELVIGADVVLFAASLDDHRFPAFAADHEEQRRSAERLRELRDRGLIVMPGHDPELIRPGPLPLSAGG
jgi:glyoxylase-like metal-dependent hydrolase (beta-lactamase superfamily II)